MKNLLQNGLTLLELLISLAISASILAGVVQIYANSTINRLAFEGHARIQENSRFVFAQLERDIFQSGSTGCLGLINASKLDRVVNGLGYQANEHQQYDMASFVTGFEQTNNDFSDKLVIRLSDRAAAIPVREYSAENRSFTLDASHPAYSQLEQYQVVYAANCSRIAAFMITETPEDSGQITFSVNVTAPANHENAAQFNSDIDLALGNQFASADLNTSIATNSLAYIYAGDAMASYHIGSSDEGNCSNNTPQFCTLLRNNEILSEGVSEFNVEYGWEDSDGEMRYGSWTDVVNQDTASQIDRIIVTASFHSISPVPTADGNEYLNKTIARVFNLRNQLPTY